MVCPVLELPSFLSRTGITLQFFSCNITIILVIPDLTLQFSPFFPVFTIVLAKLPFLSQDY